MAVSIPYLYNEAIPYMHLFCRIKGGLLRIPYILKPRSHRNIQSLQSPIQVRGIVSKDEK